MYLFDEGRRTLDIRSVEEGLPPRLTGIRGGHQVPHFVKISRFRGQVYGTYASYKDQDKQQMCLEAYLLSRGLILMEGEEGAMFPLLPRHRHHFEWLTQVF